MSHFVRFSAAPLLATLAIGSMAAHGATPCAAPAEWQSFASRIGTIGAYGAPSNCAGEATGQFVCAYPNGGTMKIATSGSTTDELATLTYTNVPYYKQTVAGGLGTPAQYDLSSVRFTVNGTGSIRSLSDSSGNLTSITTTTTQTWRFWDNHESRVSTSYTIAYGSQGPQISAGTVSIDGKTLNAADLIACSNFSTGGVFSFPAPTTPVDPTEPIVGNPNQPLPPPPVAQTVYVANDGKLPETAVEVKASGTLGNATLEITLDLAKLLSGTFASGYNVYLAALVPGRQIGAAAPQWFMKLPSGNWDVMGWPISAFLENVAAGSVDQKRVISIVANTNLSTLIGTEVYVGYGLNADEMLSAKRYRGIYKITSE